ncbi:MAG: DUF4157 domain-containing protein [Pyrinomonadaceae bacterium]|nr:DUF4157 domain-containing protein [Pyrinomonadaceae bacterium]
MRSLEWRRQPQSQQQTAAGSLASRWAMNERSRHLNRVPPVSTTKRGHDFSRVSVNAQTPVTIQPKLVVNASGDLYEQEADRVADKIMRAPATRAQRAPCACGGECSKCGGEREGKEKIQTKSVRANDAGVRSAPPVVHEALSSVGQPLAPHTRESMEQRFGHDFSRVRVHTDAKADRAARSIQSRAFTVGHDVVFRDGQYAPDTDSGQRLLAHELTHVVQQKWEPASHLGIVQRAEPEEVESQAADISSSLSASDKAILREYLELLRAGRINSEDNAEIYEAMAALEEAVQQQAELATEGSGSMEVSQAALGHGGVAFAAAGALLADDVTVVGTADDVAIPPAVLYGLGALAIAGAAYVSYLAFSPSDEELEKGAEEVDQLVRELMDKISKASKDAKPETKPEPKPEQKPPTNRTTDVFPPLPEDPKKDCQQRHPYALVCEDYADIEEVAVEFLMSQGYSYFDLGNCWGVGSFGSDEIDACDGAPGERWHCSVGEEELSIFACLCCDEDGTTSFEWRGAHWSIDLSKRR